MVNPWLLGFLIGDGCFRGGYLTFTTADYEIVERVATCLVAPYRIHHEGGYTYSITKDLNGLNMPERGNYYVTMLTDLGLWGKKSEDKHLPSSILNADKLTRLEVLRGLMDSDGYVAKDGQLVFAVSSKQLALDVQHLIWSLGGSAKLRVKKTTHLDSYKLYIRYQYPKELVSLSRKKERANERLSHSKSGGAYTLTLTIDSIEEVGEKDCQCISVSHPSALYLTDDYIVTHNTWVMLYSAMDMWAEQERDILFVSMEMPSEAILARVLGMYAKVNAGNVKNAELSESEKGMVSQGLRQISLEKAKFWVLDANLSGTVSDVFNMVAHLQPDAVFIDGAYLLRNENPRLGRYERVAENVEVIKRMAHTSGVPCLTSWQFNREASKKKKKDEKPGLEDIGYSDAIGQISSVVLGLMEEESCRYSAIKVPSNYTYSRVEMEKSGNSK